MRSFKELDDIYNDLSWLEDADLGDFRNPPKAMTLQQRVSVIFNEMNKLVHQGKSSDQDGSKSHLLLDDAVELLEALNSLHTGVRY